MKCHKCTIYKDTLHGAPGVRGTTDPEALKVTLELREKHLQVQLAPVILP